MRATTRIGATVATLAITGALLLLVAPAPTALVGELTRALRVPQLAVDRAGPDRVALTAAAATAWLVLCWLGCTLALLMLGALPGLAGRAARGAARRIVPGTGRRLLATALGLGLAAGAATPVWAGPGVTPPHPPVAGARAGALPPAGLDLDWPVSAPAPETGTTVTVRSGDSLWSITDRHLGPDATAPAIAAEWPRWWAANRHTVGADPDVIHPGQRLRAPGPDHLTGSTS
jgi:hypothetical protein